MGALGAALALAAGLAAVGLCLIPALRYMKVPARTLRWTLAAHVFFIAGLALAVAPRGGPAARSKLLPILVELIPPEERLEPVTPPETEPMYVAPPEEAVVTQVTLQELPTSIGNGSMSARLLSAAARPERSDPLRRLAPNAGGAGAGTRGVVQREREGAPDGTAVRTRPTGLLAPQTGEESALPAYRARAGDSPFRSPVTPNPGSSRVASPGVGSTQDRAAALPEGSNLEGEVQGRALKNVPDPPSGVGADGGTVKLKFEVKPNGQVYNVVIKEKAGSPQLERLAREWTQKLLFAPLPANADQKDQSGEITVVFKKE